MQSRLRNVVPLLAVAAALAWAGCEWSPVPLSDPPSVLVDPTLAGAWLAYDVGGDSVSLRVAILPFNGTEYFVEVLALDLAGNLRLEEDLDLEEYERTRPRYRLFMTDVGGRQVANIQCLVCDESDIGLYRYALLTLADSTLTVRSLQEDQMRSFQELSTAREAHAWMAGLLASGAELEEPLTLVRIREP